MDYNASTPVDPTVSEAMAPFFASHFGNPHSSDHIAGWRAHEAVDKSAGQIAAGIGADPDEVIFTSGATEANNLAILGLARRAPASRRRIVVSAIEHKCVLAAARAVQPLGFSVEVLPVLSSGLIDLADLEYRLRDDVLLVSVMAVNNEIGTIQPIAEVSRLARNVGALVHTDAVQALTAGVVDVDDWAVDLLSLSAHKLYGPKGIGALYVRRHVQPEIEPLVYGGGQQNGLRSGTVPVPLCVGFAAAVGLTAGATAAQERAKVRRLRDEFVREVSRSVERVRVNGPADALRHPGNANLCFEGRDAHDLLGMLQPHLAASTGSACTSGTPEPSHVLRAIGLSVQDARASVRFGIGRFTSETDIARAIELIAEVADKT